MRQDAVVKWIQNVYGLVNASFIWHKHAKKGIKDCGFKQSPVDPCPFYKKDVLFILYMDDTVVLTPDPKKADQVIADLREEGYTLTDEGDLLAYLGLQIEQKLEMEITISQPAFIDRIIKELNLKDQRMHDTPSDSILKRDKKGEERKIGQLNYLAATTKLDILFAVHHCAQFSPDPKLCHKRAVKDQSLSKENKRLRDEPESQCEKGS